MNIFLNTKRIHVWKKSNERITEIPTNDYIKILKLGTLKNYFLKKKSTLGFSWQQSGKVLSLFSSQESAETWEPERVSRWWRKWGSWRKGTLKLEYGVLILPPSCTYVKLTEISRVKTLNKHCSTLNFAVLLGSTNVYFSPNLGGFLPLFLQIHFFFLLLQSLPPLPPGTSISWFCIITLHYVLSPVFRLVVEVNAQEKKTRIAL